MTNQCDHGSLRRACELCAAQTEIEALTQKHRAMADAYSLDLEKLRQAERTLRCVRMSPEGVWRWQGDPKTDDVETLTCPVVLEASEMGNLIDRLTRAEAAERHLTERIHGTGPGGGLVGALEKAESERDELRAWQVEVAEGLGFLNRADGVSGYEVADAVRIVETLQQATRERDALTDEVAAAWKAINAEGEGGPIVPGEPVASGIAQLAHGLRQERDEAVAEVERLIAERAKDLATVDQMATDAQRYAEKRDAEVAALKSRLGAQADISLRALARVEALEGAVCTECGCGPDCRLLDRAKRATLAGKDGA